MREQLQARHGTRVPIGDDQREVFGPQPFERSRTVMNVINGRKSNPLQDSY